LTKQLAPAVLLPLTRAIKDSISLLVNPIPIVAHNMAVTSTSNNGELAADVCWLEAGNYALR
jgi:hypothetical protein